MPETSYRSELKELRKKLIRILTTNYLFVVNLTDVRYELSSVAYTCAVDFLCNYRILHRFYWFAIFIDVPLVLLELTCFATDRPSFSTFMSRSFTTVHLSITWINAVTVLNTQRDIGDYAKGMKRAQWSLRDVQPRLKAFVKSRGIFTTVCTLSLVPLSCAYLCFLTGEIQQSHLLWKLHESKRSELICVVTFVETTVFMVIGYMLITVPVMALYFTTELEVQVVLLVRYVRDLREKTEAQPKMVRERFVFDALKTIVKRQVALQEQYEKFRGILTVLGLQYLVQTLGLSAFLTYAVMEGKVHIGTSIAYFSIYAVVLLSTMEAGQRFENAWHRFYGEMCNLSWYTWSRRNRKMYLPIVTVLPDRHKIFMVANMAVNYDLLKSILKIMYSAANAIVNIHANANKRHT